MVKFCWLPFEFIHRETSRKYHLLNRLFNYYVNEIQPISIWSMCFTPLYATIARVCAVLRFGSISCISTNDFTNAASYLSTENSSSNNLLNLNQSVDFLLKIIKHCKHKNLEMFEIALVMINSTVIDVCFTIVLHHL